MTPLRFLTPLRLLLCGGLFAPVVFAASQLTPLSVSTNHRYLQDGNGRPFFLVGDSPQNLPIKLRVAELEGYMAECALRGFNVLWVCIDGQRTDKPTTLPPQDREGRLLMREGWNIGTLNPAYFETIDAILATADRHGIYCLLTPLSECQWVQANIDQNPPSRWRDYGRFLGRRYGGTPNILWLLGNDNLNKPAQHAIVEGLKEAGDRHLMTINWRPGYHKLGSSWVRKHEHGESWVDLDAWYRNGPVKDGAAACYWQKTEYERPDPMPSFQSEAGYQQPDGGGNERANVSDLYIRMQNYYVALGGGCGGHVYGAGWMADPWEYAGYRDNCGRIQTRHFRDLFAVREWWTLIPDYGHTFVTAGFGTLTPTTMDYVGAAVNAAGTLGLAYCPRATTITVDLGKFRGPVTARWFDPTNGAFTPVAPSPLAPKGTREFSTPGENIAGCGDWVLLLEADRAP